MQNSSAIFSLLQEQIPSLNLYNELFNQDARIRPEWETFFSSLHKLGFNELQNRNEDVLRLLKENGVAYNIYTDPIGQSRPWELDPIPHIINATEWETVTKGLVQRAELLNLLLQDIYGPQLLIKNGVVPQELIYMHPGFVRSCVNVNMHGKYLTLYAADLARGDDGRNWVISDRTQAPSGSGYALENRLAMSQVLPELFQHLSIKKLSTYFELLHDTLVDLAPRNTDNPKIVILTPGPENETYFEHSYLASYLGLTLVQGTDLMVKDNHVWLKTIEGLEKVDVILRRVDDIYCDPLELKNDSLLGVPGLLQVVRKGNVAIANPLGSSIVENTGLVPFLPAIAKYFFGTDLIIPSIATWWCGQPTEMKYVIENLSKLAIRKIFRGEAGTHSTIDGESLSSQQKEELIRKIQGQPHLYTGQEKISFSPTPSFRDGKIETSHSLCRVFLTRNNNSYITMPGGLTRSTAAKSFIISNQMGGISKDTWVISSEADMEPSLLTQKHNIFSISKKGLKSSLPSHTAESLFWIGRYTERVINNAKLQRTVMQRQLQESSQLDVESAQAILLRALSKSTFTFPGFVEATDWASFQTKYSEVWQELTDILYNEKRAGSLAHNLTLLRSAVYNARNFWSQDTWRVLLQMEEKWYKEKALLYSDPLKMINAIDALSTSMFAFLGMNRETVRREQGWNIMDLGRKVEQSLFTITMLKNIFQRKRDDETEYALIETVLLASQSLMAYRYTYRDHLQLPLALELVMLDNHYPKSLAYQIKKIKRYVFELPKEQKQWPLTTQQQFMEEADSLLKLANLKQLVTCTANGEYVALNIFLLRLETLITDTATLISGAYFKHSPTQKQLFTATLI